MSARGGLGTWGLAAVTFLAGLALGGFAPRTDLRAAQEENEDLRERAAGSGPGQRITQLLTGGGLGGPSRSVRADGEPGGDAADPADRAGAKADPRRGPDRGGASASSTDADRPEGDGETRAFTPPFDDLDAAAEGLALRRAQAREALAQATGASEAQMAAVDAAADVMNDRLVDVAYELVEATAAGEDPDRRTMMVAATSAMNAMIEAEDAMRAAFPDADLEDAMVDPSSFLDAAILDVLFAPGDAPAEAAP